MPKIIFTSRYMKNPASSNAGKLIKYMGTREGVEKLPNGIDNSPATKNQNDLIYVLKLFDLDEEDNSSALIDLFEKNIQLVTKGDYNEDHQRIEKLSKVFDYAINTKNLIDKKTYNSIVNILYPLVECYKNNPE